MPKSIAANRALVPVIITVLLLLPFINKAFHMDDPLFIWAAKHIQAAPTDFYGFSVNWYGADTPMSQVAKNPPLTSYYIALVASLFGWSERALHIAFLIPAAFAALGIYRLSGLLCSRPVVATLVAVITPAFWVSATNIMCDVMMLAFWVWALYFWVKGMQTVSCPYLFLSSFLVAAAALTKYFGISLLGLFIAYSLLKRNKSYTWVVTLIIPAAAVLGYEFFTHISYGKGLFSDAALYAGNVGWDTGTNILPRILIGLAFIGGCFITAFFLSPFLHDKRFLPVAIFLLLLIFGLICFAKPVSQHILQTTDIKWTFLLQFAVMAAAGFYVISVAVIDFCCRRNAESVLLFLWIAGTFIFTTFVNWTINARSLLPMAPAVGIVIARRMDAIGKMSLKATVLKVVALILALLLSAAVCLGDYYFANSAKVAASGIRSKYQNLPGTVWFQGHWGFQYYMEQWGARPYDFNSTVVTKSDIIVLPLNNTNVGNVIPDKFKISQILRISTSIPLITVSHSRRVCFYSHEFGPVPFLIGQPPVENYYILVVK